MSSNMVIRTVALAGASGNLGPAILNQLLAANFAVTVLTRAGGSQSSTFPPTVKAVVPVDYDSLQSLTSALQGHDAVISTLASTAVGGAQTRLVDAAVAAGVKRFIPSEFGSDVLNPLTRKLPVYGEKVKLQEYLEKTVADNPALSYTTIMTGPFFDWGLKMGLLLGKEKYDGGERRFSVTRLDTIGRAVVAVLQKPQETHNRHIYVHEAVVTQNQLAQMSGKEWDPVEVSTEAAEREAYAELGKEQPNMRHAMFGFMKRAVWGEGYGCEFEKVDNDLLGIRMMSEKEIEGVVKEYIH